MSSSTHRQSTPQPHRNRDQQTSQQSTLFRIRKVRPVQSARQRTKLNNSEPTIERSTAFNALPAMSKTHLQFTRTRASPSDREKFKMLGLWDQYEDIWFDIQSESIEPLFSELSLPESKEDANNKRMLLGNTKNKESSTSSNFDKTKPYRIRLFASKFKNIEESRLPCEHCGKKKRRGVYLGCKHYFCRECVRDHVQSHIQELKVPVNCLKDKCKYILERSEVISNAPNSDLVMKLFDAMVADNVRRRPDRFVLCFTDNCKYLFDLGKQKDKRSLRCPRCHQNYCIACHGFMKPGHHCEDFNTEKTKSERSLRNIRRTIKVEA